MANNAAAEKAGAAKYRHALHGHDVNILCAWVKRSCSTALTGCSPPVHRGTRHQKARGGLPAPGFFECARRFAGDPNGQDAVELNAVLARWGGSRDN
jgi:hypothetical protein